MTVAISSDIKVLFIAKALLKYRRCAVASVDVIQKHMKVCVQSIFANIPGLLSEELCQTLFAKDNIRIERIISKGHCSEEQSWYDQTQDEWVLLLQGQARLMIEGQGEVALGAGDYVLLPAHCRHQVRWTAPEVESIWLAIHVD
jgi:cupin 2 domain-containing protein